MQRTSNAPVSGATQNDDDFAGAAEGRPTETPGESTASPVAGSAAGSGEDGGVAVLDRPPGREPTSPPAGEVGKAPSPSEGRAEGGPVATSTAPPSASPRKQGRKRRILAVVLLAALVGGGYEGYHWWTVGRFEMATDDAYLGSDFTILSAKVSGYVTSVDVTSNQSVKAGDVIARIDDGDYRLAVQSARDKIAMQKATIERIGVQVNAARAKIDEAKADVASAQAGVELAKAEFDRKTKLAKSNFGTRQALDNARADRDKALAALQAANAGLASAEANVAVLNAEKVEAEQTLKSLQTALSQAERDLAYTVVKAPVDGVVGNKAVDVGELVQPGTRLAAVVPLDTVYVDANFKETQLARLRPGQEVTVEVDAFPDRVFQGEVESISPASGALFSLLPPENATGNFTKIVQRLPVRIALAAEATKAHVLRPGMSAVVSVDTRTDAERALAQRTAADIRARMSSLIAQVRTTVGLESADAATGMAAADRSH